MPGSLLTSHDALSERSEASYVSSDSRASGKKVSFNRAVRVKQYPWTPDDGYLPEDGTTHLSLPSRRFWFKVYKVKPQQAPQNGDYWQDHSGSTYNGQYSQPTNSWEEDKGADSYDSLAPIVEDDGTDHEDKMMHGNGEVGEHPSYHRSHVKDIVSKFSNEAAAPYRKENGMSDTYGYTKHNHASDSSRQTTNKNSVLNGFKTVLARSQAKLKGERKDTNGRNAQENDTRQERYNYRATSPSKQSLVSNTGYEADERSSLAIKIPRAESPRREKDNIERFSMRYKTPQRRSRSTDGASHSETYAKHMLNTDKSVSTDDLNSSTNRINKDKSTQCNGTLLRSKPLAAYGTPRLPRGAFSVLSKREQPNDKKKNLLPQNSSLKSDAAVNNTRPYSLTGRSADDSNHRGGRTSNHIESSARNPSSQGTRSSQIITKPRIAMNSYRSQNNKSAGPAIKAQEPNCGDQSRSFSEVKSEGLYERSRGLNVVPEERSVSKHNWNNTPLVERRATSWERSRRPTAATVGYHSGRYVASQRLRGDLGNFEASRPSKAVDRNRFLTPNSDAGRSSSNGNESAQNTREISSSSSLLRNNGTVPATGDTQNMIDWSMSGFQLGPPTVDRGLVSDSECFVHQRPPLLMYIPGVSHHEKPAVEEDRMSGISGISRGDMDDDLRPISGVSNSYVFNRRNSMPKDSNKNWVKWKVGGKPSR